MGLHGVSFSSGNRIKSLPSITRPRKTSGDSSKSTVQRFKRPALHPRVQKFRGLTTAGRPKLPEKKNELSRRRPFGVGSTPALPFRGTIGIVQILECSQGKGDRAATHGGQLARVFLYPAGERPALMANVHTNRSRCDRFTVPLFSQLVCSGVDASPRRLERPLRVRRTAVKKRPLD